MNSFFSRRNNTKPSSFSRPNGVERNSSIAMKRIVIVLLLFRITTVIGLQQEFSRSIWHLKTDPDSLDLITEHKTYAIHLTLVYNAIPHTNKTILKEGPFYVAVSSSDQVTLGFNQTTITFDSTDVAAGLPKTLYVTSKVIGYANLDFNLNIPSRDTTNIPLLDGYRVSIIRASDLMDQIFVLITGGIAVLNTINMGCALDLAVVQKILRRPLGPAVGFFSQFMFMPLFALAMSQLLIKDPLKGFGLLVLGTCPGGIASNFWTLLLDGDVNLSITMTFVSSISAMGMLPLWLWLLSGYFPSLDIQQDGNQLKVPYLDMVVSLFLLTIPIGIGLLIRRFKRNVAEFISTKIIKPFTFCCILTMFGLGFYTLSHIFILMDVFMVAAGLAVAGSGFIFGGLLGWIARLNRNQIVAVSLETAMQNGNIAFILLKTSLPSPYADIAALAPIAQILMTSSILYTIFSAHLIYRCVTKKQASKV